MLRPSSAVSGRWVWLQVQTSCARCWVRCTQWPGQQEAARVILSDLVERCSRSYVSPILVSWIYANLQEPDSAFEWLGKAYDERTCTLGSGIGYALFDGIRDDPRFGELVQKLGLS